MWVLQQQQVDQALGRGGPHLEQLLALGTGRQQLARGVPLQAGDDVLWGQGGTD